MRLLEEITMSKRMIAVCALVLSVSAVGFADEIYNVYNYGSGALYGAAPAGMRFGDVGHVSGTADGGGICTTCFGVNPPMCDPCWRGPCIDWKLIGWYSNWHHHNRGCPGHGCKRCGESGAGRCCASTGDAACETCN
jgi:hypothetical protein